MKKTDLWTGLGMIALGFGFLAAGIFWDTPLGSLFCGFFGALAAPGALQVWKYVKWTRLETADSYQRHVEEEQIELRDERKVMLRDKSGRYAYTLGLLVLAVSILLFSILGKLGLMEEAACRLMTFFLAGFLLFQYAAGVLIFRLLEQNY